MTERSGRGGWLLPHPADVAFVLLLLSAAVVRGWQAINTDGDLGRHLRVGETILDRGGLFHQDLFSWTMAGQPFVPYEWLSEIVFALAHRAGGLPGVVALSALVIAGSYLLLALLLRRRGVDPLLAFLVTMAAGLVSAFHWLARPHLFSLLGVAVLVWMVEGRDGEKAGWREAVGVGLLLCVWANLHGGFLFGLVLLGMYLTGDALGSRALLPRHALLFVAALAGTLVNPVGPALLEHVTGYLGKSFLVDTTMEYRSPDFHGWVGRAFLAVLLLLMAGLALSRRPMPIRWLLVILGTTAFALHSVRNVPLWALTALPLAALHLDPEWRALSGNAFRRVRAGFAAAERLAQPGAWSVAGALVLIFLVAGGGRLGGVQVLPDRFDSRVFPVEAVAQARAAGMQGKMFNELGWGGYLLNAWPEQAVFIDGQTDFYGEELSREYVALRAAEPGWEGRLRERGIELVLLPPEAPLADALRRHSWTERYRSDVAVLMELRSER